jgi:hypothetical protein
MILFDGLEVGVVHGFARNDSLSVIVGEHFREQVDCFWIGKRLVTSVYKFAPLLFRPCTKQVIIMAI